MENNEFESYVKAGEIAKAVKSFARGLVKPGVKLIDIAKAVDAKIVELGGESAFPVNLSLNEVAAHYTPAPGDEMIAEGILKVDIGVCVDGFIADTAFSVDLTSDGKFGEMIALNEKILEAASGVVKVGMEVREVGDAVQETLDGEEGFRVIKSLSGHSLGENDIHAGITISNYRNDNRKKFDDVAFAIEPFVTSGVGDIYEGRVGGIYVLQSEEQVRDRDAREVLKFVKENYKSRPFCLRWLVREAEDGGRASRGDRQRVTGNGKGLSGLSVNRLKFILGMLVKQGIIHEYPMLIEKSKAPVSQAENTFLISGGKVVCTTA